jgi:hypothetical protein
MLRAVSLAALAVALAGCSVETKYIPRTPHTLALGMRRRQAGIYKDGVFTTLSNTPVALAACSAGSAAAVAQAVLHEGGYDSNLTVAMVFYFLSPLVLPLYGVGIYFDFRADDKREQSYPEVVDAINRYNDEPACVAP